MPESTSNVEFAHRIHEQAHHGGPRGPAALLALVEAFVLAAVAVLTAWSGYQAARWDARSAKGYAEASATTAAAQEQQTLAGQDHLYDIATFNSWMAAKSARDEALAGDFEKRFRPEFATAYAAWMKTNPFQNPEAAPGPSFVPEYRSARLEKARVLGDQARAQYETGVLARETGDEYVRITVVLATVLLLTALSQRFRIHVARVGLVAVATVMLVLAVYWIATFPRA